MLPVEFFTKPPKFWQLQQTERYFTICMKCQREGEKYFKLKAAESLST